MRNTWRILAAFVAAVLLGALVLLPPIAQAEEVPKNATWTQVWFPSKDGTMLHADVFLPKDRAKNERHPVIVSIGPYFGSGSGSFPIPTPTRQGPVLRFNDLITEGKIFERGYAYVQVDSRGYGGSDGCFDLGGEGEQMDATATVEWAAKQKWSNGRVGMWGKSYDAWTQVMALAHKPKGLAAAVIQSPLIEGYRGFYMNGVHYDAGWYATPGLYAGYDLFPPALTDSPPEEFLYPTKGTATNPHCYAENLSLSLVPDHSFDYWTERDIIKPASKSRVPVLWSHGFNDANTKPDNFLPVYSKLQGPKRAWFGQYAHDRGNEVNLVGRDGFMDEAMAWLDRYLKGLPPKKLPDVEVQDSTGFWRTESQWPPTDGEYYSLRVLEGTYVDERGLEADGPAEGTWTFTESAPYELRFAGLPKLALQVETSVPRANVIALLYDVAPDGEARLISRAAYLIEEAGKISFELYPQDWLLEKGHRFGLLLMGSDESWFSPYPTNTQVTVRKGVLRLPFLRFARVYNLDGRPAQAMSGVPELEIEKETIKERTAKTNFPPPLRRR
jgi:predicted acyl esterase